ncbi:MAG: RagB/SusD family nutrient uptake outer membrane protein [Bacteroidota bacterium]
MKNITKYILGALVVFAFGCEGLLDESPQQSLPLDGVYQTTTDLETALVGAYNAFQHSDFAGCNLSMSPDIIADNGDWRGSFPSFVDVSNQAVDPTNGEVLGLWANGFRVINDANLILESIDNVDDGDIATAGPRIRGEALFLRGAAYFEMVRFFGKPFGSSSSSDPAVPLVTASTALGNADLFPARASVEAIYAQAVSDLTTAEGLLPESNGVGFATSWAAKAYLAEIAFQKGEYAEASSLAAEIIAGPFALTDEPKEFFTNESNTEAIFVTSHTSQDNPGVNGSLPTFHHIDGRGGDVVVSMDLMNNGFGALITTDQQAAADGDGVSLVDLRLSTLTSDGGTFTETGGVNIEKYDGFVNNDDDAPIYRLAEFLLMRAEALVRVGDQVDADAIALLNQVRTRAFRATDGAGAAVDAATYVNYEAGDFANAQELLDAIILERRVELAFEGNRFHDLNRIGVNVKGTSTGADALVWPVPQRDIDANSSLVQNPGY